jgi:hypothetical protein
MRRCSLLLLLLCAQLAHAVKLRPETKQAFDHYDQQIQQRVDGAIKAGNLITGLSAQELSDLRRGEIVMQRASGIPEIPNGLIHHWVGTVFIPRATVSRTLALLQDYNNHRNVYRSEVVDSKLLSQTGNEFRAYMRFYKKKIIGVTLNTEHLAKYVSISPTRAWSISHSTRIAEVDNAGKSDEHEKPIGDDNGFLWALNSYWRLEERDGGVFVQCEAVSLTRDIPTGLGWLVKPFITEVPRESLRNTMESTRTALTSAK